MNEVAEMAAFRSFASAVGVTLLPHQEQFCDAILSAARHDDRITSFMTSGRASGKTLALDLLERYFQSRRPRNT